MQLKSILAVLNACASVSASKSRVVEKLVDAKSPSIPTTGRSAEIPSNGTDILFERDLEGLNIFPPQDCNPERSRDSDLCPDGNCCKTTENCITDGCCDKPMISFGAGEKN